MSVIVALEGLLGVGKSTLGRKLISSGLNCEIYWEETNRELLSLFYREPKRYSFTFQWGMLQFRLYQERLSKLHRLTSHRHYFFWDRSLFGDYIFAFWNHLLGSITKEEFQAYQSAFGGNLHERNLGVNILCLLEAEPAECKRRVEKERGNAEEQGIPLSYYQGIDDLQFFFFIKLKIDRLVIAGSSSYDSLIDGLKGKKVEINFELEEDGGIGASEIKTFYRFPEKIPDPLVISYSAMRRPETYPDYPNLIFWENKYKRVVMNALGTGKRVIFRK